MGICSTTLYSIGRHWRNLGRNYKILFCVSLIGVGHFALSMLGWVTMFAFTLVAWYKGDEIYWSVFLPATIAFVLFVFFIISCVMAWKSKRATVLLVLISLCATAICFAYETKNEKWQIQMMTSKGCKHVYNNWPFYDGPN